MFCNMTYFVTFKADKINIFKLSLKNSVYLFNICTCGCRDFDDASLCCHKCMVDDVGLLTRDWFLQDDGV